MYLNRELKNYVVLRERMMEGDEIRLFRDFNEVTRGNYAYSLEVIMKIKRRK